VVITLEGRQQAEEQRFDQRAAAATATNPRQPQHIDGMVPSPVLTLACVALLFVAALRQQQQAKLTFCVASAFGEQRRKKSWTIRRALGYYVIYNC
jgi:hypothetical protein